jgi:hypothetical protein
MTSKKSDGFRGWSGGIGRIPRKVPEGRVLAHNHVMHTKGMPHGLNGFRCFTWPKGKQPRHFVRCPCGWSGLPHYAWREHVKATGGKCETDAHFATRMGWPEKLSA